MPKPNEDLNLGKDSKSSESANPKDGKMKKIILIVAAVVLIGGGAAAFFLMGGGDQAVEGEQSAEPIVEVIEEVAEEQDPIYQPLDPAFVVNFKHNGKIRYLQVRLQVMSYDQEVIDKVKMNMPAVRNSIILLLSSQEFEALSTLEGKDKLRKQVMQSIQEVVRLKGSQKLEDAFFTDFVIQ